MRNRFNQQSPPSSFVSPRLRRGIPPQSGGLTDGIRRHAFTLLEVMVVAVIVVLMLGMALPVFRAITGSRSEAGATNHITAMLNRARADAIGLQKPIGVVFITNPATQAQNMAEVSFPDCGGWSTAATYPLGSCVINPAYPTIPSGQSKYYICSVAQIVAGGPFNSLIGVNWQPVGGPPLEIRPDTDLIPLPAGIGVQTVCNCNLDNTGARTSDGYLNAGVILFDGQGRMISQNYGLSQFSYLGKAAKLVRDYPVATSTNAYNGDYGFPSQFGLVVFQREAFISQNFSIDDVAYSTDINGSTTQMSDYQTGQKTEESWLDQNATPLVINRYTGTLIRAE